MEKNINELITEKELTNHLKIIFGDSINTDDPKYYDFESLDVCRKKFEDYLFKIKQ